MSCSAELVSLWNKFLFTGSVNNITIHIWVCYAVNHESHTDKAKLQNQMFESTDEFIQK